MVSWWWHHFYYAHTWNIELSLSNPLSSQNQPLFLRKFRRSSATQDKPCYQTLGRIAFLQGWPAHGAFIIYVKGKMKNYKISIFYKSFFSSSGYVCLLVKKVLDNFKYNTLKFVMLMHIMNAPLWRYTSMWFTEVCTLFCDTPWPIISLWASETETWHEKSPLF